MPFKISSANADHIVFTRLSSGCGRFVFIFVGSVFTIIGICLIAFLDSPEMPVSVFRFLFPVFGLIAIFAGIKLPALDRRNTPDEIVFDNANGRVEIRQSMSD
ncbi:MAG TPA: hypothetical protein VEB86_02640, partial [Chryseosolibacter sp.]|nr:hypothetical protein [Chryseosolibacter sp.]